MDNSVKKFLTKNGKKGGKKTKKKYGAGYYSKIGKMGVLAKKNKR